MASTAGYIVSTSCKHIIDDQHWLSSAYTQFAVPYFIYDIYAMFLCHWHKHQVKGHGGDEGGARAPDSTWAVARGYLHKEFLMVLHHAVMVLVCFPLSVVWRQGKGDFFLGCLLMAEVSTPFVCLGKILIQVRGYLRVWEPDGRAQEEQAFSGTFRDFFLKDRRRVRSGKTIRRGRGEAGSGTFNPALSDKGKARKWAEEAGPRAGRGRGQRRRQASRRPSLVSAFCRVPSAVQAAAHTAAQGERGPDAAQLPLLPGAALPLPVLGLRAARGPATARRAPRDSGPRQPGRRAAPRPPALLVLPHLPRGLPPLSAPELPAAFSQSDPGLRVEPGDPPPAPPPHTPRRGQGSGTAVRGWGARDLKTP
ncbi:hypothetical protein HJG60_004880 [Phyllostomus discolor]|nr:hypothetical protein HJG60_004880 [Phyllostomus discolor]